MKPDLSSWSFYRNISIIWAGYPASTNCCTHSVIWSPLVLFSTMGAVCERRVDLIRFSTDEMISLICLTVNTYIGPYLSIERVAVRPLDVFHIRRKFFTNFAIEILFFWPNYRSLFTTFPACRVPVEDFDIREFVHAICLSQNGLIF